MKIKAIVSSIFLLQMFNGHAMESGNAVASTFFAKEQLGDAFKAAKDVADKQQRIQVSVLNQFSTEGSSAASCGYHALRNGLLLADAVLRPQENSLAKLKDVQHMNELLNSKGTWRTFIRQLRIKEIAALIISHKLMATLKGGKIVPLDATNKEALRGATNDFRLIFPGMNNAEADKELALVVTLIKSLGRKFQPDITGESFHYVIDPEQFYMTFMASVNDLIIIYEHNDKAEKSLPLLQVLQQGGRDKFAHYFAPEKIEFTINLEGQVFENGKTTRYPFEPRTNLKGDWIDTEEMDPLINFETLQKPENAIRYENMIYERGILQGLGSAIAVFDSGSFLFANMLDEKYINNSASDPYKTKAAVENLLTPEFKRVRRNVRTDADFTGLVLVYISKSNTMGSSVIESLTSSASSILGLSGTTQDKNAYAQMNQNQNYSHWITLLVIGNGGKRQYVIADSMGSDRLNDPTINKIIALLEGYEDTSTSASYDAQKMIESMNALAGSKSADAAKSSNQVLTTTNKPTSIIDRYPWLFSKKMGFFTFCFAIAGGWGAYQKWFKNKPVKKLNLRESLKPVESELLS